MWRVIFLTTINENEGGGESDEDIAIFAMLAPKGSPLLQFSKRFHLRFLLASPVLSGLLRLLLLFVEEGFHCRGVMENGFVLVIGRLVHIMH